MSDELCVGVCMMDWDSGVCLGCGRTAEEIDGVPVASPAPDAPGPTPAPASVATAGGERCE